MNNAKTPLFHPAPNAVQTRRRFLAQGAATSLLIAGLPVIAQARVEASAERAAEIRFLGKADAAVTVAEYFSMTCGHCGRFHRNTFPQVKTD